MIISKMVFSFLFFFNGKMEKHVLKVPKGGIFMVFIDIIEGRCPRAIHCVSILKGGLKFGFERFHYLD